LNCSITNLLNSLKRVHGKYSRTKQRRTEKSETGSAQKAQSGTSTQAPRLRARVEEAKGEEAGARTIEAVAA
jgi:hypothetical protein